jgi:NAD(P)-dependent dehydrogenase (short-subunit alcohol dehydrogenase family)
MSMEFEQRAVLVTGAAGTLGRAVAQAFAARGAALVLIDLARAGLEAAYGAEDAKHVFAPCDLLDREAAAGVARLAIERLGRIDVLCNIAGGFQMGEAVHEASDAVWTRMLDLNVRTLLNAVRAVTPQMIAGGGGKIVNVGAFAAQKGAARMGAYVAAKSVVIRLTETMAAELREQNINVNCVLPTIIDTPPNRRDMPKADPGRWVAPADLAQVILFLASDAARAVHGAALPVTGLS